jgi:hypothetical protein
MQNRNSQGGGQVAKEPVASKYRKDIRIWGVLKLHIYQDGYR